MKTSLNKFLGGKIELLQPINGFRAGTDTVMMAAAVPAKQGDNVLELGAGAGVALCCLGARVEGLELIGVELQAETAALAQENLQRSNQNGEVICSDIFELPKEIRMRQFDHVMMNPPFYKVTAHTAPYSQSKATAHIAHDNVSEWVKIAAKRLRPKGSFTIIHRAECLVDILGALNEFGDIRILPISSSAELDAKTVIVQARKQSAGKLKILPPFLTHDPHKIETSRLKAITRDGEVLRELI